MAVDARPILSRRTTQAPGASGPRRESNRFHRQAVEVAVDVPVRDQRRGAGLRGAPVTIACAVDLSALALWYERHTHMTSDRAPAATVRRKHLVKWTIFLAATACVALLCVLVLQPLFAVLGWSAALAIAFNPLHRYFVRKTGRVSLSALLCSVLVVVMVLLPFLLVSALAFNQFIALTNYLQDTFKNGFDLNAIEPLRRSVEWLAHWGFDATAIMNWISGHGGEIGRTTAR